MLVIISLEVKVREFIPKLFLAYKILKEKNFEILIGPQRLLFNRINNFENSIFFDKNTFHKRFGKNFNISNNFVCMLDEEGPIYLFDDLAKKFRYSNKLLTKIDKFYFWGKKDLNKISKKFYIHRNKASIVGHPKFDLLKKPYNKIFSKELDYIKKKYGRFVLFASSFEDDSEVAKARNFALIKEIYKGKSSSFLNFEKKKMIKYLNANSKNYIESIELFKSLAISNPQINFVFRKHPHEDDDLVKLKFNTLPKNLYLEYNFQVSPWIIASSLYIHAGCTTSFEAACCNKKIIFFAPNHNFARYKEFKKFGNFFFERKKCLSYVNNFLLNIIKFQKKYYYKNLNSLIYNLEVKNLFYERFINDIKKVRFNKDSRIILTEDLDTNLSRAFFNLKKLIFSVLSFLKSHFFLKSFLISYLPEKYLYSFKDSIRKFDKLEKKEIKKLLYRFNQIDGGNTMNLSIKKISNSVFHLKNN
jgi:hypothetical protein